MAGRLTGGSALIAAALLAAACGGPGPTPAATGTPGSPGASAPVGSAPAGSAPAGSPSASPASAVPSGSGPTTAADPRLLDLIGGDAANGLTFQYDPETTAQVAADPGLAAEASALAIGLYTVTGQDPVADYAIVSVVRLRDPEPDESWFRSYRDSYDASACEPAGGVAGHAEAEIGGRTVFIGTCAGGAFTYHVLVPAHGAVVSITGVGPGRLGERIAADIEN